MCHFERFVSQVEARLIAERVGNSMGRHLAGPCKQGGEIRPEGQTIRGMGWVPGLSPEPKAVGLLEQGCKNEEYGSGGCPVDPTLGQVAALRPGPGICSSSKGLEVARRLWTLELRAPCFGLLFKLLSDCSRSTIFHSYAKACFWLSGFSMGMGRCAIHRGYSAIFSSRRLSACSLADGL